MSTCKLWGAVLLSVSVCAVVAACGAESGDCLRFTDCAQGLTCAAGRCVVPPPPASASAGEGGTTTVPEHGVADAGGGDDAADEPGLFDDAGSGLFDDDAPGG